MALSGDEFRALELAILDAFPTYADLRNMVRGRLGLNLAHYGDGSSGLGEVVFNLIQRQEAAGEIPALVRGAWKEQPNNSLLKRFIQAHPQLGPEAPRLDELEELLQQTCDRVDDTKDFGNEYRRRSDAVPVFFILPGRLDDYPVPFFNRLAKEHLAAFEQIRRPLRISEGAAPRKPHRHAMRLNDVRDFRRDTLEFLREDKVRELAGLFPGTPKEAAQEYPLLAVVTEVSGRDWLQSQRVRSIEEALKIHFRACVQHAQAYQPQQLVGFVICEYGVNQEVLDEARREAFVKRVQALARQSGVKVHKLGPLRMLRQADARDWAAEFCTRYFETQLDRDDLIDAVFPPPEYSLTMKQFHTFLIKWIRGDFHAPAGGG